MLSKEKKSCPKKWSPNKKTLFKDGIVARASVTWRENNNNAMEIMMMLIDMMLFQMYCL